jgi:hypothetical protein
LLIRLCQQLSPAALPELEAMVADPGIASRFQNELVDCIEAIKERAAAAAKS